MAVKKVQYCLECGKEYIVPFKKVIDYFLCSNCIKTKNLKDINFDFTNIEKKIDFINRDDKIKLVNSTIKTIG